MDGRISHIREAILENLSYHWTIQKMAQKVGLSLPHFQKLFKSSFKSSPMFYLREKRLEKAREFLEATFLQIQEIRLHVGMRHESHFTRDFKKKYGVTPTEYRKEYWEKLEMEKAIGQK